MRVELLDAARRRARRPAADRAPPGNGANCAATAGSRRTAVTCRSACRAGRRRGRRCARAPHRARHRCGIVSREAWRSIVPAGRTNGKGICARASLRPLMSASRQHDRLPRTLGLWSSVALVIGITIGSGIFRSPAGIAQKVPSPTLMLALWVVGGLVTLCGALSLAELAAALPETGGFYAYIREGWGRQWAFCFGWSRAGADPRLGARRHRRRLRRVSACAASASIRSSTTSPRAPCPPAAIAFAACANIVGANVGAAIVGVSTAAKFARAGDPGRRVAPARRRPRRQRLAPDRAGAGADRRSARWAWRWSACCGPTTAGATCRSPPARSRIRSATCRARSSSARWR